MMMTGLISGFTLATTRVEAQAIHTDTTGLDAGEIKIPCRRRRLPAYFARPDGAGPFPIVLVIEEIFGVHEYIKDSAGGWPSWAISRSRPSSMRAIGDLSKMTDAAAIVRDVISKAPDDQMHARPRQRGAWAGANERRPGAAGRHRVLPRRARHLALRRA